MGHCFLDTQYTHGSAVVKCGDTLDHSFAVFYRFLEHFKIIFFVREKALKRDDLISLLML